MATEAPSHAQFVDTCREAFGFLVEEFGFGEAPCSDERERFCVRFANGDRSLQIRGEGYGTTAACDLLLGEKRRLSLIDLVPEADRPKRSRKRDRMGQLDRIRECGELARAHAVDFFRGDVSRFTRLCDARRYRT